ncbi:MAG: TIGR01244 family sulfur transferase [Luminiphilus sp.]|nr:TIGR01244 family sulfur transferase [Luminiphilus sp.]
MATTPIIQLSETVFVAGQIQPEHMVELAAQGFKHVICNRPDYEVPGQATMNDMAEAAQSADVSFTRYPIDGMNFPGEDLAALTALFDSGERVLAYCRTGTRCANLWIATRSEADQSGAIDVARGIGFDLSLALVWRG